jgi:hypothetical protein
MELREHPVEWIVASILLIGALLLGTADFQPAASHSSAPPMSKAENM